MILNSRASTTGCGRRAGLGVLAVLLSWTTSAAGQERPAAEVRPPTHPHGYPAGRREQHRCAVPPGSERRCRRPSRVDRRGGWNRVEGRRPRRGRALRRAGAAERACVAVSAGASRQHAGRRTHPRAGRLPSGADPQQLALDGTAASHHVIALQRSGEMAGMKEAALEYLRRYPAGFRQADVEPLSR